MWNINCYSYFMKKILLASQYRTLLQKYADLLANCGFRIFTAVSGSEALRLHREHRFDLIVSDYELAGMTMGTFCSLLRQEGAAGEVPIIITCHNIASRIERARQIGACAIVLKPVEPIRLLEAIGNQTGLNLIRGKRVELDVVVTVSRNNQELVCSSRDISTTGILIKSSRPLQVGESVTCRFTLPGGSQVDADGEVVRFITDLDYDNLYGIRFESMSAANRQAISSFINLPPPAARSVRSPRSRPAGPVAELTLELPEQD